MPFALWIGFWFHSILSFGHEAAHYNLSASKKRNDMLSDWTIWLFFSANVQRSTGKATGSITCIWETRWTPRFPTTTVFPPVSCVKSDYWNLSGGIGRSATFSAVIRGQEPLKLPRIESHSPTKTNTMAPLLRALTAHAIIVAIALSFSSYATAITWVVPPY